VFTKLEKELIDYVFDFVNNETNDWFIIKTQIIQNFPPKSRKKFAKRHYSTKKRMINDFDLEVISYWEKKSGSRLVINQELLHPSDWKQRPSGWALKAINEQRKRQKSNNTGSKKENTETID